jgi:hypothetical protein
MIFIRHHGGELPPDPLYLKEFGTDSNWLTIHIQILPVGPIF